MDVFALREDVVADYSDYVTSFLQIRDPRVEEFVRTTLHVDQALWPAPLLQLNPSFEPGPSLDPLIAEGLLHEECRRIFAVKDEGGSLVRRTDRGRPAFDVRYCGGDVVELRVHDLDPAEQTRIEAHFGAPEWEEVEGEDGTSTRRLKLRGYVEHLARLHTLPAPFEVRES